MSLKAPQGRLWNRTSCCRSSQGTPDGVQWVFLGWWGGWRKKPPELGPCVNNTCFSTSCCLTLGGGIVKKIASESRVPRAMKNSLHNRRTAAGLITSSILISLFHRPPWIQVEGLSASEYFPEETAECLPLNQIQPY